MAKLIYALNQSLDGYIDQHEAFAPDPVLFRHFINDVGDLSGILYGRRMYETMRYWDEDRAEWNDAEREYAAAWRRQPKWVVSRSLTSVGPNAGLIGDDVGSATRALKAKHDGKIEVAGPELAGSLAHLRLIDEYQLYVHPVVLCGGKPFFAASPPPLRFVANDRISENVIRLTYVPA